MLQTDFKIEGKQAIAYYHLTETFDPVTNEVFYGGGAGSGKSYLGAYWHLERRLKYPGTRGVVGRESLTDLRDTWLVSLYKLCAQLKLVPGYHFKYNGQLNQILWYNGSRTILKELRYLPSDPNFDRLGSTEYTDAIIEEAPQIQERAFDVINSRLRWDLRKHGLVPKILLTGNASESWVRNKYVCDDDGNIAPLQLHKNGKFMGQPYQEIVLATVEDNPDPEFREDYIQQLERISSEYDKERLRYGNWLVKPRLGRLYFPDFDSKKHVGYFPYKPSLRLHHTFDFNKVPYATSIQIQIEKEENVLNDWGYLWHVNVIGNICPDYPDNRTRTMAKQIVGVYGRDGLNHQSGGFMYGDYTQKGKGYSALEEGYEDEYGVLEEELRTILSQNSDRVIPNRPVEKRRNFVLDILKGGEYPIQLHFDKSAKKTIDDMLFLKQDKDGNKLKEYYQDRATLEKYQKYGHTSDALEYFLTSAFEDYFDKKIKKKK